MSDRATLTGPIAAPAPAAPEPTLLFIDADPLSLRHARMLRCTYAVAIASTAAAACDQLERMPPALLVTDVDLPDASGLEVCRRAKALTYPPAVLVTVIDVARAPDAILARCDGVLVKPFAPNLLFARLGRLHRERSVTLGARSGQRRPAACSQGNGGALIFTGTNTACPATCCPRCGHAGVTSFDFTSYRRAWYACLECRHVWIAKRQQ